MLFEWMHVSLGCHEWSWRCACVYVLHVDALVASLKTQTLVGIRISHMVFDVLVLDAG
jgi:hypothetical protein